MQRVFKRANLETYYSEGYHLRPLLSFGPALTLGISSLTEYFDVRVPNEWTDFKSILARLQEHSEPGIIFKGIEVIDNKTPSIQDAARAFNYFVPVKNAAKLSEVVEKISSQDQILIQSYSKKLETFVEKDIKPMLLKLTHGKLSLSEDILKIIDEVSPCRSEGIFITSQVNQGSGVRPSELTAFLQSAGIETDRPIKVGIEI